MTGTETVTDHWLLGMASILLEITPSLLSLKSINRFLAASALSASTVDSRFTLYFIAIFLSFPNSRALIALPPIGREERRVDFYGVDSPGRIQVPAPPQ